MDQRAKISIALFAVACAACLVVATGVGAATDRRLVQETSGLSDVATPGELLAIARVVRVPLTIDLDGARGRRIDAITVQGTGGWRSSFSVLAI